MFRPDPRQGAKWQAQGTAQGGEEAAQDRDRQRRSCSRRSPERGQESTPPFPALLEGGSIQAAASGVEDQECGEAEQHLDFRVEGDYAAQPMVGRRAEEAGRGKGNTAEEGDPPGMQLPDSEQQPTQIAGRHPDGAQRRHVQPWQFA